jgi:hypothetical protein
VDAGGGVLGDEDIIHAHARQSAAAKIDRFVEIAGNDDVATGVKSDAVGAVKTAAANPGAPCVGRCGGSVKDAGEDKGDG